MRPLSPSVAFVAITTRCTAFTELGMMLSWLRMQSPVRLLSLR